jgi:lipoate-protein ligase A
MIWNLLKTGAGEPAWNMALDEALLEHCGAIGTPVLRLYGWNSAAATFGYSQHFQEVARWTTLRPLIRRATGGGLVPHEADWTYSLVFPPNDPWYSLRAEESYRRVHDWVSGSFRALEVQAELSECCDKPVLGRCFVGAEKFDVLAGGKKIAGAAQKRNKFGLLVQGSIQPPDMNGKKYERAAWESAFVEIGERDLGIEWRELKPAETLLAQAMELTREKYSTDGYNQRR